MAELVVSSKDLQLQIQLNQDTMDQQLYLIQEMAHAIQSISIIQHQKLCPTIIQWLENKIKSQNQKKRYHQLQLNRKAQYQENLELYKTQNIFRIHNRYYTKGLIKVFRFEIHQFEADHQCLVEARPDGLHVFSIKGMSEMESATVYNLMKCLSSYICYNKKTFIKCKYSKIIQQKLEMKSIYFDLITSYRTFGLHFYCSEYILNRRQLCAQITAIFKDDLQLIRFIPKDTKIQQLDKTGYQILSDYILQKFRFEKQLYEIEMEYNNHHGLFVVHCREISFSVRFNASIRQKLQKILLIKIQNIEKATFNLKLKSYSNAEHEWIKQAHFKKSISVVIDCELADHEYLMDYLKELNRIIQRSVIKLKNTLHISIQHFNYNKSKQVNQFVTATIQLNSLPYKINNQLPFQFILSPSQNLSNFSSAIANTLKQLVNYFSTKSFGKANDQTADTSVDGDLSTLYLQEQNESSYLGEQLNEGDKKYLKCPITYSKPQQKDICELYQKSKRNTRYQNIINQIYNIHIKIWDLVLTSQIQLPSPHQIYCDQIYFTRQLLQDKNIQIQNLSVQKFQDILQGDFRNKDNTGFGIFLTADKCRFVPLFVFQILGK